MTHGEQLGGFRIVRVLGSGSRADVYLGHGGGDRTAALKVYRPGTDPGSIDAEINALGRAAHAHTVQLRDVGSAAGGLPFLVLERLGHGSLAQLLAGRSALSAGEAVTILAPLAAAVGALHGSGISHGTIGVGSVLFRETGAPVLAGFGHASLLPQPASAVQLASSLAVLEDRLATSRLARAVLERVPGEAAAQLGLWLSRLERDGFPDTVMDAVESRVFDLATAAPIRFVRDADGPAPHSVPPRLHRAEPLPPQEPESAPLTAVARVLALAVDRLPVLERLRPLLDRPLLAQMLPALRTVRRPVWVAAGLGLVSLVAALAIVPTSAEGDAAPPPSAAATAQTSGPVAGDDPVAALPSLLAARAECVRELSILCLEAAVQAGSAALDDDIALIRSIEAGETSGAVGESETGTERLVERHGDAALLDYRTADGKPASVLLVKGEAGWRIRDYVAAVTAVG